MSDWMIALVVIAVTFFAFMGLAAASMSSIKERQAVRQIEDEFPALNDRYSNMLGGKPVTITSNPNGFGCWIDFEDGTFGAGHGPSPFAAFTDAQTDVRFGSLT